MGDKVTDNECQELVGQNTLWDYLTRRGADKAQDGTNLRSRCQPQVWKGRAS